MSSFKQLALKTKPGVPSSQLCSLFHSPGPPKNRRESQKKINKILYYILITQYKWKLNKGGGESGRPRTAFGDPSPSAPKNHTLINKYPFPGDPAVPAPSPG